MSEDELDAYVRAALALHGYRFDPAQVAAITQQFARVANIAAVFVDFEIAQDVEPAPVFRP